MLSVSSEAAPNVAFHGAPQRLGASHPPANDLFDALVGHNAAADTVATPPAPLPRRSEETTAPAEAAGFASKPSSPPPVNDSDGNANASPTLSSANAGPPAANANANGPADSAATEPSQAETAPAKDDSAKSTDQATSGDTIAIDPTILAQQASLSTPVPIAAAAPVNATPANVPAAAPSSGGSTPPLAIAQAAIAATSQALSGQGATPSQGKTDPNQSPTATTTPALSAPGIKIAASVASSAADASPVIAQARQLAATTPANAPTLSSAVAAAAPVAPKTTPDKTSASSSATDSAGDTDLTAGNASAVAAQNGQQQAAGSKTETANAALATTSDAGTASAAQVAAHEHAPAANNAGHAFPDSASPAAQAFGALQAQANSATAPTTAGQALSLAAAANGPVPLSGLALEIAASVKSGKSRFEIRLDPAELGRIDVRIDIDRNGQVTSHLTVEKPETLFLLRQDAPQLQRALDDAGLKTGNGGLQFSLRDQSSSSQNNGDSRPDAQRLIIADEDTIPASVAGRTYGRSLGGSGGVDIRV